ncbi:hypothetical protein C7475_1011031 [Chitinophaga sp. S165]|nr:hypothetical protein C7475_1011031 [Chitinophaga sp. S165]
MRKYATGYFVFILSNKRVTSYYKDDARINFR